MQQNKKVTVTPTVDTNAFATGDVVGTLLTFTDLMGLKGAGSLRSILVTDLAKQSLALDLILFDSNPSATTFTENAAIDIADADLPKVCAVVSVAIADYVALNDSSFAFKSLDVGIQPGASTIYGILVARGSPTYGASDVSVTLTARQD